jgi:hypothetical protein
MSKVVHPRGTKMALERFRFAEIARNTPESQVWASGPVTTFVPRFSPREEYRFEEYDSTLFCALKPETRLDQLQLARALRKKGV